MDRMQVILKAYEVADEIKQSADFQALIELKNQIDMNFKNEIIDYHKANHYFNDIMSTGGQYHPNFKEAVMKLSAAKKALFDHDIVKQYFLKEKAIQKILDDLSRDLANKVSSHIGTPNELGILKESSCHAG